MSIVVESNVPEELLDAWLQSEKALDRFVSDFLSCTIPRVEWTHRAHLGIGATLVLARGREKTLDQLRQTIPQLNIVQGTGNSPVGGYHETLTVFWVERIAALLVRLPAHFSRLGRVRTVVEAYGGIRRLDRAYYSYDVLRSLEARRVWLPPDL